MKWGKLVSSATPRPRDQVSIWSVTARDAKTFFRVAAVLWLVAITYIVFKAFDVPSSRTVGTAVPEAAWESVGDFALAVLAEFGAVGIAIAMVAMLLARALNSTGELLMSLYQTVVNRFVVPVIEAHKAEGREEGREEGRTEGRTEVMAEWRGWNERRMVAERAGREFDEPPPGGESRVAG